MTPKEVSAIVQENNLLRSKMSGMMAENIMLAEQNGILKGILQAICKAYVIGRPVLMFLKIFAFVKKGGNLAIDAIVFALDQSCATNKIVNPDVETKGLTTE